MITPELSGLQVAGEGNQFSCHLKAPLDEVILEEAMQSGMLAFQRFGVCLKNK